MFTVTDKITSFIFFSQLRVAKKFCCLEICHVGNLLTLSAGFRCAAGAGNTYNTL